MHETDPDPAQASGLSSGARAVLLEVDRMATAGRDLDRPTADLLSRVHEDLVALIDLLESGRSSSSSITWQGTLGEYHARPAAGGSSCRVLPGEI
jgi:hypothetical protein